MPDVTDSLWLVSVPCLVNVSLKRGSVRFTLQLSWNPLDGKLPCCPQKHFSNSLTFSSIVCENQQETLSLCLTLLPPLFLYCRPFSSSHPFFNCFFSRSAFVFFFYALIIINSWYVSLFGFICNRLWPADSITAPHRRTHVETLHSWIHTIMQKYNKQTQVCTHTHPHFTLPLSLRQDRKIPRAPCSCLQGQGVHLVCVECIYVSSCKQYMGVWVCVCCSTIMNVCIFMPPFLYVRLCVEMCVCPSLRACACVQCVCVC